MLPPVPLAATTMLTPTVCVLVPDVKLMVPPQVEPPPMPLWLTETENVEGDVLAVKKPEGVTVSQLTLVQLCSDTATEALVELCAVTDRVWAGGRLPLATALNVIP